MQVKFLPHEQWDILYDALPRKALKPTVVGNNLLAFSFFTERGEQHRFVRGNEADFGLVEKRILLDDFDLSQARPSTRELAMDAADELVAEGVAPHVTGPYGARRQLFPAAVTHIPGPPTNPIPSVAVPAKKAKKRKPVKKKATKPKKPVRRFSQGKFGQGKFGGR